MPTSNDEKDRPHIRAAKQFNRACDELADELRKMSPADCERRAIMDFTTAWAFVRQTKPEQHHERCSWRVTSGAILCDCSILNDEYKKRATRSTALAAEGKP